MSTTDLDLFSDETLADPYPVYARLREQGRAVYVEKVDAWALTRFADVRSALTDAETFSSADGVALNHFNRESAAGTVIATDGAEHAKLRRVLSRELAPRAIADLRAGMDEAAAKAVGDLVARGGFDFVRDLAQPFVLKVVTDLIGLPDDSPAELLAWGNASFDTFGPLNARTGAGVPHTMAMFAYAAEVVGAGNLKPGSWGAAILAAAERGDIAPESCVPLMGAYLAPALDTTISAFGTLAEQLARNPEQWAALKADPALVGKAFDEALRFDAPLQVFARKVRKDVTYGDTVVPAGAWAMMLYGAANRDQSHFGADADTFDLHRDQSRDHLAFGAGPHTCAGLGVARLQAEAVFGALAASVETLELDGEPERHLNNTLRGLASLPVRVK